MDSGIPVSDGEGVLLRFLGGADEVGASALALESGDTRIIFDYGRRLASGATPVFHNPETVILPPVKKRALFLTHGHLDHIGSLPLLLEELDSEAAVTVYAGKETAAITASIAGNMVSEPLLPWQPVECAPFTVTPFPVFHSAPGAFGFFIRCHGKQVVLSGDFSFPDDQLSSRENWQRVRSLAEGGIDLFICDGTALTRPRRGVREAALATTLKEIFQETKGDVFASCFSSNWGRIALLTRLAKEAGRRLFFMGRSLERTLHAARSINWTGLTGKGVQRWGGERGNALILAAGTQGEGRSAFSRLSETDSVGPEDAVLYSAVPVPGNEIAVRALLDRFARRTSHLYAPPLDCVHASGHASRDDIREVLDILQPRYWVPVHTSPASAVTALRDDLSNPDRHSLHLQRGAILRLEGILEMVEEGEASPAFSALPPAVERAALVQEGFLSFVLVRRGRELGEARLFTRGFIDRDAGRDFLETLRGHFSGCAEEAVLEGVLAASHLAARLRREMSAYIADRTGCFPEIVVEVLDVTRQFPA